VNRAGGAGLQSFRAHLRNFERALANARHESQRCIATARLAAIGSWDFHANALTSSGADAPAISASSARRSVCTIRTNPLRNLHGRD
jgi:hypothetical protein